MLSLSPFISFPNLTLFTWSEAIVFFVIFMYVGQCTVQCQCGLTVLSDECDCHIVPMRQIKIDRDR